MLERVRARIRRRRVRLAVVCAVVLLGATVATAHTNVAVDHMGQAAAMCLAIVVGGTTVAALAAFARPDTRPRAPVRLGDPSAGSLATHALAHRPRGDPALLQVFRR
jgi:peptidoglycan/LPS O-acetylase OafA/YrhL